MTNHRRIKIWISKRRHTFFNVSTWLCTATETHGVSLAPTVEVNSTMELSVAVVQSDEKDE